MDKKAKCDPEKCEEVLRERVLREYYEAEMDIYREALRELVQQIYRRFKK